MLPLKNSWVFPVIEVAHLTGVALLAGTAVMIDIRRLGWSVARQTAEELEQIFKPWALTGLALLLCTGLTMTLADWDRYRLNPAFAVKIALTTAVLASYFAPRKTKTAAIISLTLWTAVVLASRAIADFDI